MKYLLKKILNLIFKLFPVKENKILFDSGRNKVDDNPFAIYKYFKQNANTKYILKYIVKKGVDISNLDKRDVCYYNSLKGFYHLATSQYLIKSQSLKNILKKKKNQIYIQTWHGSGAGKKMGNDLTGNKGRLYHTMEWDYLLVTDEYNQKIMCSSTGFPVKKTFLIGSPVTDLLNNYTNKQIEKIKIKVGIEDNKKVVLYAPTFRDEKLKSNCELKINRLSQFKDYIFLIRFHPIIEKNICSLPDNFINVSDYPDINDLYLISDILITDYSSSFFVYSILNRPMIFYAYDYKEYMHSRGFYINYKKEVPGPIVKNETDLIKIFNNIDILKKDCYKSKIKKINKQFNLLNDGCVNKRFYDLIESGYFKNNKEVKK